MKKVALLLILLLTMSETFSQTHFIKGHTSTNPNNPMNIYIRSATIEGIQLQAGDEIAVFDGNMCCGLAVLSEPINPADEKTYISIMPYGDEPGKYNGYTQGNKIYFRFWDSSEGKEYYNVVAIARNKDGAIISNTFAQGESAFIEANTASTTKTWTNADEDSPNLWNASGNWSPSGVPEPNHDVVISSGLPTISSTTRANCGSLTFNNSTIRIRSESVSPSIHSGSLIVGSNISGNGVLNSRRFMTGDAWHLVSSPVSGQTIAGFLSNNSVIAANGALKGMMEYEEGADNWSTFFTNSTSGDISLGKGLGIRTDGDNYVTFQGSLPNGNVSVSLLRSNHGWNLLGNPFTSAMFTRQEVFGFLTENSGAIDQGYLAMYIWSDTINKGAGGYAITNFSDGEALLASGQGFFIKAASSGSVVTFTNKMQYHKTDAPLKSGKVATPSIVLNAKTNNLYATTKINFIDGMTLGLDPGYDAGILRNGKGFDIYTKLVSDNGVDFAIQALPGKSTDRYMIPIGVDAVKGDEVVFSVQTASLPAGYDVMLEDKLTNTVTNLKNGELYVANVATETKGTGRFYLHVGSSVQTKISELTKEEIVVYTIGQTLYVKGNVSGDAQFLVYSIDGRLINQFGAKSQNLNQMSIAGYTPGIYFVNIQDNVKHKPVKFVVGK